MSGLSLMAKATSGNGEGYLGIKYVDVAIADPCADGGRFRSIIEVTSKQAATMTRDNCKDVQPQTISLSQLQLLPHNDSNLVNESHVFDRAEDGATSQSAVMCRGNIAGISIPWDITSLNVNYDVVDLVVYSTYANGDWAYSADFKAGGYDRNGKLLIPYTASFPVAWSNHLVNGAATKMDQPGFTVEPATAWGSREVVNPGPSGDISRFILYLSPVNGHLKAMLNFSIVKNSTPNEFNGSENQMIIPADSQAFVLELDCYIQ
jgi:hypothetical protein